MPGITSLPCAHAASFCMSLRGAERRGNPYSLRQGITKQQYLGRIRSYYEFALSIANLPSSSTDTRQVSACHWELRSCNRRNGFPSACHCEERSDVAIRIPRRETRQVGCCLGKFVRHCVFAQSTTCRYAALQRERIATSLRSSQ